MDSKKRFSNRVDYYVRYRPSYPQALLEHLVDVASLDETSVVADIGSGTGLSTKLFLDGGFKSLGVEPNQEMRLASESFLSAYGRYEAVDGSAEATSLAASSVDLIVAGQAFHWFDPAGFRSEVERILRPAGMAAVFWNDRPAAETPFLYAYEQLLKQYALNYGKVVHRQSQKEKLEGLFGPAGYQKASFPNLLTYDRESLIGRVLSSSYTPLEDHPNHLFLIQGLYEIFDRYEEDGIVSMPYNTIVFWGPVRGN